jgi:hypothetical protein
MRQHYLGHVKEVLSIIDKNAQHQAIIIGLEYFENLLDRAAMDALDPELDKVGARGHLLRLYDNGVRPVDMLAECGGLYLLHCREPNRIMDQRHLVTLLGHRLIRMVPLPPGKRPRGSLSRAIGGDIMKNIGVLLVNLQKACERSIEKESELRKALAMELEV